MKIVFTICSNNYLAQAFTLGDSLAQSNPDYHFFIGLCDRLNDQIDYALISKYPIVDVSQLGLPSLDDMASRYNIIELNTAVKPFYFQYFFAKYEQAVQVLYIDPDIFVYEKMNLIDDAFLHNSFQLTPHILTPIPLDGLHPGENFFLKYGIYNLGFLGLKRSVEVHEFLEWWGERLKRFCYKDVKRGYFVDQKWIDLVPIFWNNVKVWNHPGMNMAYWNFHERHLDKQGDRYLVNDSYDLIFFHFSSLKADNPNIERSQQRVTFAQAPALQQLYLNYCALVMNNHYLKLRSIGCSFGLPLQKPPLTFKRRIANYLSNLSFFVVKQ